MRVIVTRPARQARQWVQDLLAHGLEAVALPLIEVRPVDDPARLVQVRQQLADYVGVLFVSGNAVDHFFASDQALAGILNAHASVKTRAWATGPGTAKALLRAGVAPERIDAPPLDAGQFDSETLWQVMGAQVHPADRVLIVRGGDTVAGKLTGPGAEPDGVQGSGRDWFARQAAQAGAQVDFVLAYQRCAPVFSPHDFELARQAASDGSVWLFSSTEALTNLGARLPEQSWLVARALATHPRIALAAKEAGFAVVYEARPTLSDVLASLSVIARA